MLNTVLVYFSLEYKKCILSYGVLCLQCCVYCTAYCIISVCVCANSPLTIAIETTVCSPAACPVKVKLLQIQWIQCYLWFQWAVSSASHLQLHWYCHSLSACWLLYCVVLLSLMAQTPHPSHVGQEASVLQQSWCILLYCNEFPSWV